MAEECPVIYREPDSYKVFHGPQEFGEPVFTPPPTTTTTTTTTLPPTPDDYNAFWQQQIDQFDAYIYGIVPVYPPSLYIEDPGFWGRNATPDLDFSGVSLISNTFCETMVTPSVCIAAWHWHHQPGSQITWKHFLTGDPDVTRTVTSAHRVTLTNDQGEVNNADLAVVFLDSPVPATIPKYSIPAEFRIPTNPTGAQPYSIRLDKEGKAHFARCFTGYLSHDISFNNSVTIIGQNTLGAYPWENLVGGDSSKPTFFLGSDKKLILVGSHASAAADVWLGYTPYQIVIQDFIDIYAPGEQLDIVDVLTVS